MTLRYHRVRSLGGRVPDGGSRWLSGSTLEHREEK
jgi:hypothetical protein